MRIQGLCVSALILALSIIPIEAKSVSLLSDQFGTSAHMIGIGNIEGMTDGITNLFGNVASIESDKTSLFMTTGQLVDSDSTLLIFGMSVNALGGTIGAGVIQLDNGAIDYTEEGDFDQFFSKFQFSLKHSLYVLGYQRPITQKLSTAISMKYMDQDLYTTRGTGINTDIGVVYKEEALRLSLSAKNIIKDFKVKYSHEYGELDFPFQMVAGARYDFSRVGLMSQIKYVEDAQVLLPAVAVEYHLFPNIFSGSIGWKQIVDHTNVHDTKSVGAQLSLNELSLAVSYEFSDFFEKNALWRFTIKYGW
jgi:hypothetical protein